MSNYKYVYSNKKTNINGNSKFFQQNGNSVSAMAGIKGNYHYNKASPV